MKASFFVSLPYGQVAEPVTTWPVPNRLFDPQRAVAVAESHLEEVELADSLGFDWIGCAEHHYSPGSLAPNVSVVAAAITQRARRARVCIMGALLPLNNPVRIAEEYALIDTLSGGRLVAGLLRGAPYEYLVYNVPPAESRARFEEAWELIMRAWCDTEPFGWEGEHYQFRNVSIWPRPIQQPLPPVFISGSSRESAEFAARHRIGLGLAFTNIPQAAPSVELYRKAAEECGWQPRADQIIYGHMPVYLADTDAQAFEQARPRVEHGHLNPGMMNANRLVAEAGFFGSRNPERLKFFQTMDKMPPLSLEQQIDMGLLLCGSPGSVINQLHSVRDRLGAGVVSLDFNRGDPPATRRTIEQFGRDVLPAMHEL
ncbi:MAG: LLM class flavin-dependent oxidoreductase [Chloroflexi bacterium]|nr:LLM class flavin-dependent oxidoreductase [Chloroflexota bacterium]MBV9597286.1 LLM class flavin-dependent oxidoreductase [Chloroflexota bacterium]